MALGSAKTEPEWKMNRESIVVLMQPALGLGHSVLILRSISFSLADEHLASPIFRQRGALSCRDEAEQKVRHRAASPTETETRLCCISGTRHLDTTVGRNEEATECPVDIDRRII